jgi:hypothetical protein
MSDQITAAEIEVLSAGDPSGGAEDFSGTVGGPAAPHAPAGSRRGIPDPIREDDVAEVTDGSLAAKLAAVGERLQRTSTRDFPIPDTPLVLRARSFRDRKAFRQGLKTEAFIVRATAGLFLRDEDTDELEPIPPWGTDLARLLGFRVDSASDLVRRVLDNPVRLEAFAAELIEWMAGRSQEDEQALGE